VNVHTLVTDQLFISSILIVGLCIKTCASELSPRDKIRMGIAASNGLLLTGVVSMSLYRLPSLERIEGVPTVIGLRTIGHAFRKTPLRPFASDGYPVLPAIRRRR
jgi:hypothetical protein